MYTFHFYESDNFIQGYKSYYQKILSYLNPNGNIDFDKSIKEIFELELKAVLDPKPFKNKRFELLFKCHFL
jgi:hypothetical protein